MEDYYCPECPWVLHIGKEIWSSFPYSPSYIEDYIKGKIEKHMQSEHQEYGEDIKCPYCPWSLHIEKRVWGEVSDYSLLINYIQSTVSNHNKMHRDKDMQDYISPYITHSDTSDLTILSKKSE